MNKFMWILLVFIVFIILTDLYSFKGLLLLIRPIDNLVYRKIIIAVFWLIPLMFIFFVFLLFLQRDLSRDPEKYYRYYLLFGAFLLIYLPKLFFIAFHLMDDLVHLTRLMYTKIFPPFQTLANENSQTITRYRFLTQFGLIIASLPFAGVLYGMVKGRFDFRIENVKINNNKIPNGFHGLKIIQISDIHIGSFIGQEKKVKKAIDIINSQNPDVIVFTGDLVNNFAEELNGWIEIFRKLNARYGKYSILGNHDYGDYFAWNNKEEKERNLQKIKTAHADMGFKLLLNDAVSIEKNGEKIDIAGVENWGLPPFHQYGDLDKALHKTDADGFRILLSHDPSHWDAEILKNSRVDLTLSGHTHGMQFGIRIGHYKWSPVKMKYPRWSGLYNEGKQFLYVNRGFGYIGFPGRVGMPPEITVIELERA